MSKPTNIPDPEFASAHDVCELLLDVTRKAYFENDCESYLSRFLLPVQFGTFSGNRMVEREADLRAVFYGFRQFIEDHQAIDMKRKALSARFLSDTQMQCTFVSYFVFQSLAVSDEITTHGTVQLTNGRWKIETAYYATEIEVISRIIMGGQPPAAPILH